MNLKQIPPFLSLALLFGVVFVATFVGGTGLSVLTGMFEEKPAELQPPPYPKISESLQSDLNAVMFPSRDLLALSSNPFIDSQGLSLLSASGGDSSLKAVVNPQPSNDFPVQSVRPLPTPPPYPNQIPAPVATPPMIGGNSGSSPAELAERLAERRREMQSGNNRSPVSEIYAVDDVRPLGVVGNGSRRDIRFYSAVTKQTFLAPLGASFRDGIFETVNDYGVVFRRNSTGETFLAKWTRASSGKGDGDSENTEISVPPVPSSTSGATGDAPLQVEYEPNNSNGKRKNIARKKSN